jgi:imidazolonepropionase-like amidohydrolase/ABC-type multidrug transport system permease subunit
MKFTLTHILVNLKLTVRDRAVLFFTYAFPLIFFFLFGELSKAREGAAVLQIVTMVLVIGVLGAGFFGAGMRAIMERENNILRRFKVAPITPAPIVISSLLVGLISYLPSAVLIVVLAHFIYGMSWPAAPVSFLVFVSVGVLSFRALGSILASVVNTMQESQILIQVFYLPMLFLSGATIPLEILPHWLQIAAQFLPATHLFTGLQAILVQGQPVWRQMTAVAALTVTMALGVFLSVKLFRWEKEEKLPAAAKLWVVAVFAPFLVLGVWEAHSQRSLEQQKILARQIDRRRTWLIRNARIFTGDGRVIESGAVLVKEGKVAEVFSGSAPDVAALHAEPVDAAGQTLLPGLIDVHVHLSAPGRFYANASDYTKPRRLERELAAYLYSGVTTVKSVGDPLDAMRALKPEIASGEWLGARLFFCGPLFTAPGGHGTEYAAQLPATYREQFNAQVVRLPKDAAEARAMVDALQKDGVDGIKAVLEAGWSGHVYNRLPTSIFDAVSEEAHRENLPIVVHTGDVADVADAVNAHADGVEHGSFRAAIPDALFAQMRAQGTAYDPTLAVVEAMADLAAGNMEPLERPLVQQIGPENLLSGTKKFLASPEGKAMEAEFPKPDLRIAEDNLRRAWKAGVMLVAGTDSGNPLLIHGPALHRELQLWVEAGVPAAVALQAATGNAARLLRQTNHLGLIAPGRDANLLLVDGDPTADIHRTESIRQVFFEGEQIDRPGLFDQK